MNDEEKQPAFRWRVAHFVLYLVNNGDDTYWVYHVPLSDAGGSCIDLDMSVLRKKELSDSGTYARDEVIRIASLAGELSSKVGYERMKEVAYS